MKTGKQILLTNIGVALVYWGISHLNYMLFSSIGILPMPIWPAAAVAVVSALFWGWRIAPALAVGAILSNHYSLHASWQLAACIAVMNTIGPILAVSLVNRYAASMSAPARLLMLAAAGLILMPALTATGGITSRGLVAQMPWSHFLPMWIKWFTAHSVGALLFVPPILVLFPSWWEQQSEGQWKNWPRYAASATLWATIGLALLLWVGDTILEWLWFRQKSDSLSEILLHTNNPHQLLLRVIISAVVLFAGGAVSRLFRILAASHESLETSNAALTTSEASLREAQEIARIGQWELDLVTNHLKWSESTAILLGINHNVAPDTYEGFLSYVYPDDRAILDQLFRDAVKKNVPYEIEHRLMMSDGRTLWVNEIGRTEYDDAGNPIRAIGTVQDITDRKLAEQRFQTSEERFVAFFDKAPVGYQTLDSQGCIIESNSTALNILGFNREEVLGRPFDAFIASEYVEVFDRGLPLLKAVGEIRTEFQIIRGDDSARFIAFEGRLSRDPLVGDEQIHCILFDITDRKLAEEAVRSQAALLEAQTNASPDGILVIDEHLTRLFINKRFIEMVKPPQDILDNSDDMPLLNHVKSLVKYPVQFLEKITYLNSHPNETSRDEIEFKNGMILDRYSAPVRGKDGKYYGRIWTFRDITERKLAEEALKQSEERYRQFFSVSRDCVFITTPEGKLLDCNDATAEMFGYANREELLEVPVPSVYMHGEQRQEFLKRLTENGYIKEFPATLRRKDIPFDALVTAALLRNPDGSIKAIIGTVHDITERKCAEEALKDSEESLRTLMDNLPAGVVIVNPDTRVIESINPQAAKWFGADVNEIIGQNCHRFLCPAEKNACPICDLGQEIDNAEREMLSADGSCKPILKSVKRISIRGEERLLECFVDISERKMAEEALQKSDKQYRELVENANSIILRWTRDGRITFLNEYGQSFFGYTADEVIGRHVMETIAPSTDSSGQNMSQLMDQVLADPAAFERNINENIRRDGEHIWIAWTNKIVMDDNGQICEVLSIGTDITERKHAEEALEKTIAELTASNESLARFNQASTDRELRMIDLKREVNRLCIELGQPEKYNVGFAETDEKSGGQK